MSLFLALAFAGLLFLVVSAFLGGHEVGGDHDVHGLDVQVDHDVHHPDGHYDDNAPSPYSLRVMAVFLTAFGVGGDIVYHWGLGALLSSVVGVGTGLGVGTVSYQFLKFLWRQQASSSVVAADFVGKVGEVKTAIPASGVGQISIEVKGKRLYLSAREIGDDPVEEGAQVFVVESSPEIVTVHRT